MVEESTKKELIDKVDGQKQPEVNRKYKDTVFRKLFHKKKELLSLYNALNDSHYSKEEELEIVTLENAIYMAMKNDLAFILDCKLNLYEHQSTPNPNIPLRDLFYVSKEYEKLVSKKTLYSKNKVRIPSPHFIVFYNGIDFQPEKTELKLSDLYQRTESEPMLELKVTMLNINDGNNEELKKSCQVLREYMQYVNRIRKYVYQDNMELEVAVELAVTECIREGILKDFLIENRTEVIAMSIFEFDEERELKLLREEEYQSGREDGIKEGEILKLFQLIQTKLSKGKNVEAIAEDLEDSVENVLALMQEMDKKEENK